jgi:hypothetical protein
MKDVYWCGFACPDDPTTIRRVPTYNRDDGAAAATYEHMYGEAPPKMSEDPVEYKWDQKTKRYQFAGETTVTPEITHQIEANKRAVLTKTGSDRNRNKQDHQLFKYSFVDAFGHQLPMGGGIPDLRPGTFTGRNCDAAIVALWKNAMAVVAQWIKFDTLATLDSASAEQKRFVFQSVLALIAPILAGPYPPNPDTDPKMRCGLIVTLETQNGDCDKLTCKMMCVLMALKQAHAANNQLLVSNDLGPRTNQMHKLGDQTLRWFFNTFDLEAGCIMHCWGAADDGSLERTAGHAIALYPSSTTACLTIDSCAQSLPACIAQFATHGATVDTTIPTHRLSCAGVTFVVQRNSDAPHAGLSLFSDEDRPAFGQLVSARAAYFVLCKDSLLKRPSVAAANTTLWADLFKHLFKPDCPPNKLHSVYAYGMLACNFGPKTPEQASLLHDLADVLPLAQAVPFWDKPTEKRAVVSHRVNQELDTFIERHIGIMVDTCTVRVGHYDWIQLQYTFRVQTPDGLLINDVLWDPLKSLRELLKTNPNFSGTCTFQCCNKQISDVKPLHELEITAGMTVICTQQ